ncbi:MAG: heavy metal-associated domain-containing protein [Myxococcota bacterium]
MKPLRKRDRVLGVGAVLLFALSVAAPATASDFVLRVDGLSCPFCAYGVEQKLLGVPGVASIEVLLDDGQIVLGLTRGAALDVAALAAAVDQSGFTLKTLLVRGAVGTLSRKNAQGLFLTSSDPRITFRLKLKADDALRAAGLADSPGQVVANGTIREFHSIPIELDVSEITPAGTRRP